MNQEETDYQYFHRRASEELDKARSASDVGLAAKHRKLSTIYTSRALQAERKREAEDSDDPAGRSTPKGGDH